jgi:hypothetical protein
MHDFPSITSYQVFDQEAAFMSRGWTGGAPPEGRILVELGTTKGVDRDQSILILYELCSILHIVRYLHLL